MTTLRVLISIGLFAAMPTVAQAQTWQPRPGEPAIDPHRYQAEQHRREIDRLRARADQREMFARQLELETRLNRQRIEAARRPEPDLTPAPRTLHAPEEERALRQSAAERRRATASAMGQIDAWLDRPRD
ncbi:MAG: hypothetical protein Q8O54_02145 [Brevundimonas sp.]|nr:hypothetical protein [Brevundimonas sp.]